MPMGCVSVAMDGEDDYCTSVPAYRTAATRTQFSYRGAWTGTFSVALSAVWAISRKCTKYDAT